MDEIVIATYRDAAEYAAIKLAANPAEQMTFEQHQAAVAAAAKEYAAAGRNVRLVECDLAGYQKFLDKHQITGNTAVISVYVTQKKGQ